MYSAQFFEDEEEEAPKKEKKKKKEKTKEQESRAEKAEMAGTVTFSIVLAVGLFMLLPAWIASLLDAVIKSHVLIGLIEGVIRLAIFLGYVIAISRMEDIKRTYMYHGAEHKTINCLEHGNELTVENVMQASRLWNEFSVHRYDCKYFGVYVYYSRCHVAAVIAACPACSSDCRNFL